MTVLEAYILVAVVAVAAWAVNKVRKQRKPGKTSGSGRQDNSPPVQKK